MSLKVKDLLKCIKYCHVTVYVRDIHSAQGFRDITTSAYPYKFAHCILHSDVVTVYPESAKKLKIEIY